MMPGLTDRRIVPALLGAGFLFLAAGCQSNDAATTLDSGAAPAAPEGKILQSELLAYCPQVTLRQGTAYFSTYERGGQDDPAKVIFQASIGEVTRSCTRSGGMVTINVAAAGRIVPGPLGKAGSVTMPIRVVVVRGSEVLYTKLHRYQVQVASANAATQFMFNDPAVVIPEPPEQNVEIFAGFDEGPPATSQ